MLIIKELQRQCCINHGHIIAKHSLKIYKMISIIVLLVLHHGTNKAKLEFSDGQSAKWVTYHPVMEMTKTQTETKTQTKSTTKYFPSSNAISQQS